MKQTLLFLGILLLSATITRAESRTEKRNTNSFTEISLRVAANLFVEQGDEHSVEITASETTLNKIIVEIDDDKLIIRFSLEDRWINDFTPGPIDIRVVTKRINELNVQGSGNIYASGLIETNSLDLMVAGSGDIKLSDVSCDNLEADIAGSGDIIISGSKVCREMDVNIAGSGDMIAYQFETETAYVKIAGSGDCEVFATNHLDVKVFGSGDITYKGDPTIKSQISGSGSVRMK